MKPPPRTRIRSGSFFSSRKRRLSTTLSCLGRIRGSAEVDPVAMMNFFAPIVVVPPIVIEPWSLKAAVPLNCFTPLAARSCFTPPVSWETTLSLCAIIAA